MKKLLSLLFVMTLLSSCVEDAVKDAIVEGAEGAGADLVGGVMDPSFEYMGEQLGGALSVSANEKLPSMAAYESACPVSGKTVTTITAYTLGAVDSVTATVVATDCVATTNFDCEGETAKTVKANGTVTVTLTVVDETTATVAVKGDFTYSDGFEGKCDIDGTITIVENTPTALTGSICGIDSIDDLETPEGTTPEYCSVLYPEA